MCRGRGLRAAAPAAQQRSAAPRTRDGAARGGRWGAACQRRRRRRPPAPGHPDRVGRTDRRASVLAAQALQAAVCCPSHGQRRGPADVQGFRVVADLIGCGFCPAHPPPRLAARTGCPRAADGRRPPRRGAGAWRTLRRSASLPLASARGWGGRPECLDACGLCAQAPQGGDPFNACAMTRAAAKYEHDFLFRTPSDRSRRFRCVLRAARAARAALEFALTHNEAAQDWCLLHPVSPHAHQERRQRQN